MGKPISVTLDIEDRKKLEIVRHSLHLKKNPDTVRVLISKEYSRLKIDKREELEAELIEKGILPIVEVDNG